MADDISTKWRIPSYHLCFLTLLTIFELLTLRLPRVCAISPTGQIHLSKEEAEEFSEDLLSVLDLDPEVTSKTYSTRRKWNKNDDSSAPTFMKDVYKELDEIDGVHKNSRRRTASQSTSWRYSPLRLRYNVSSWIENSLLSADFIVSVPQDENFKGSSIDEQQRRLIFKFDHLNNHRHLTVIGSELRLFRHGFAYAGEHMQLVLERLHPNMKRSPVATETIIKDLIPGQTGWIEVNITSFVRKWMDQPYDNGGIYIRLLNSRNFDLPPDLLGFETRPGQPLSPFVVASFDTGPETTPRRRKRSTKQRRIKRHRRNRRNKNRYDYRREYKGVCDRHPFIVDFKVLTWDWIIAPEAYNAYYCRGGCPFQFMPKLKITNHSIVQTMLRMKNRGSKKIPPTCCVPTELQPLKLLYLKDTRVILRRYRNMVVRSCGCH